MDGRGFYAAIPIGALLFRHRCRKPLIYGLAEVLVGLAATGVSKTVLNDYYITKTPAFLGGIHIIILGLDNMDKRLPAWVRKPWDSTLQNSLKPVPFKIQQSQ